MKASPVFVQGGRQMRKLIIFAAVLTIFAGVAVAGMTNPLFMTSGRIQKGCVPVIKEEEVFKKGVPDIYNVGGKDDGKATSFNIDPRHWAGKSVQEGKIPSASDGLLNPDKPIVIISSKNTIEFNFDYYNYDGMNGILQMKVFDKSGRVVGTLTNDDDEQPLVLKLSGKTQRYYIEVYDPTMEYKSKNIIPRYCYVLVEVVRR